MRASPLAGTHPRPCHISHIKLNHRILIPYDSSMENTQQTFGKKMLAVVVAGFLAIGLGLTTATTATAESGLYDCPPGLSYVKHSVIHETVPEEIDLGDITYQCSNYDGSVVAYMLYSYDGSLKVMGTVRVGNSTL